MKYEVKFTKLYKKSYKLLQRQGKNITKLDFVVEQLAKGETLDFAFHDHQLSGDKKDFRECHIEPDWLLTYRYEKNELILVLCDTGTSRSSFSSLRERSAIFVLSPECTPWSKGNYRQLLKMSTLLLIR